MVHGDHNKSRKNGSFSMIMFGALLLFLAPQEGTIESGWSIIAWIGGIGIGSLGFYLKFFRGRIKQK